MHPLSMMSPISSTTVSVISSMISRSSHILSNLKFTSFNFICLRSTTRELNLIIMTRLLLSIDRCKPARADSDQIKGKYPRYMYVLSSSLCIKLVVYFITDVCSQLSANSTELNGCFEFVGENMKVHPLVKNLALQVKESAMWNLPPVFLAVIGLSLLPIVSSILFMVIGLSLLFVAFLAFEGLSEVPQNKYIK